MKRLIASIAICFLVFTFNILSAQTVGIGTDFPIASLDIRTTDPYSSINVQRSLTPSAVAVAAIEVNDDSDWGGIDIYYTNTTSIFGTGEYIQNESVGIGVWVTNTNGTNGNPTGLFTQSGVGHGIVVAMLNGSLAFGTGGLVITGDDSQNGLAVNAQTNANGAWGLFNLLEDGVGVFNTHSIMPGLSSFYADMVNLAGTGNAYYADLENTNGSGFYASNMDDAAGLASPTNGDGYLHDAFAFSLTPPSGSATYGAAFGGDQFGNSVGMHINHHGPVGENVLLFTFDDVNPDPSVRIGNSGTGGAIQGFNDNNLGTSQISTANFSYSGTDATFDHIGVFGFSNAVIGSGVGFGMYASGGYIGIVGDEADAPNSLAGVFANGDVAASGLKPFIIDHPLDPENKMLRHYALESDEVLNVYRGVVILGRNGRAEVKLPEYFEAINTNVSYQLTSIGNSSQPWIVKEVLDGKFMIGGRPGGKVSWNIYANRNDAYVQANPHKLENVIDKRSMDLGKYLDPRSHGQSEELGILYKTNDIKTNKQYRSTTDPNARMTATEKDQMVLNRKNAINERASSSQQFQMNAKPAMESQNRLPIERMEIKTWDELEVH